MFTDITFKEDSQDLFLDITLREILFERKDYGVHFSLKSEMYKKLYSAFKLYLISQIYAFRYLAENDTDFLLQDVLNYDFDVISKALPKDKMQELKTIQRECIEEFGTPERKELLQKEIELEKIKASKKKKKKKKPSPPEGGDLLN